MAVEPSALRVRVTAHDDNGGQVEPSCTQDQIGASSDVTLPLNRNVPAICHAWVRVRDGPPCGIDGVMAMLKYSDVFVNGHAY